MWNSTLLQIPEPLLRFGSNLTSFCQAINQEDGSVPAKNWLTPPESETYWRNNPLKQSKPVQFCLSTVYCYRAVIEGVPLSAPPPPRHTGASHNARADFKNCTSPIPHTLNALLGIPLSLWRRKPRRLLRGRNIWSVFYVFKQTKRVLMKNRTLPFYCYSDKISGITTVLF